MWSPILSILPPEITEEYKHPDIRERLKDLNTKAYYLLVALSFIYSTNPAWEVKVALGLTAFVAVVPVQDYVRSKDTLRFWQLVKIVFWGGGICFLVRDTSPPSVTIPRP